MRVQYQKHTDKVGLVALSSASGILLLRLRRNHAPNFLPRDIFCPLDIGGRQSFLRQRWRCILHGPLSGLDGHGGSRQDILQGRLRGSFALARTQFALLKNGSRTSSE